VISANHRDRDDQALVVKHLELSFSEDTQAPPAIPEAYSSTVQAWRTADGAVVALGHTVDGMHWMHWPGLASFAFGARHGRVIAYPTRSVGRRTVRDVYQRSVLPVALQALGAEALHASAVHTRLGVVGFFASSETGKSTLAFELSKRGHAHWSDDSLVFDRSCASATVIRLPFRVRVRGSSGTPRPPTSTLPPRAAVGALFLLERAQLVGREPVRIEPLAAGEALSALLTHAHCFDVHSAGRRTRMIQFFLDLAANVPMRRLRFRPSLSELPIVANAVERAITALEGAADRNS